MIETGFDSRVKVQQVIESQLPEFIRADFPKYVDFLKQYYISQEYQGGPVDIAENLDQYIKLDNITPEVVTGSTKLSSSITESSTTISVSSTKGWPSEYGLLKIDDEIITYTGITTNSFTGCIRGFSGITEYDSETNPGELVFSTSKAASHTASATVTNLSALFLKEFYDKIRFSIAPGLEQVDFAAGLDVSNFLKESRTFYQSKGTPESFRILFRVLYNEKPEVIDLERYLIKPSSAELNRKEIVITERISGNPLNLLGQIVKKSKDVRVESSVSAVEILSRGTKTYYKLSLFVGPDEDIPEGQFSISGKTKVLREVQVGESVISVDSTIGFPEQGELISGNNRITYTEKSVNQFLGCSGVIQTIPIASDLRSDDTIFGYENGDLTKKVELRITGVLNTFTAKSNEFIVKEGERISVRNIGKVIKNPETNKSYTEVLANSLIYNTSSRYKVQSYTGSTFNVLSEIDPSSLKVGDFVDVLFSGTDLVAISNVEVLNIDKTLGQIQLSAAPTDTSSDYDIRRKIVYASSSGADIKYGNDKIFASVQNFYIDDEYGYIAANSLPNYEITADIISSSIPNAFGSPILSALGQGYIQGFDEESSDYNIISFDSDTDFQSGDSVVYEAQSNPLGGLVNGRVYYVQVDPLNQGFRSQIRLYASRSFIGTLSYIRFIPPSVNDGEHKFILEQNSKKQISDQRILRKIPLEQNLSAEIGEETKTGSIGILVNGVEIISPTSDDKVYYGPLEDVFVLNGGNGYDVINPPELVVDAPQNGGTTALVKPIIDGNIKSVYVDPQDFDIDDVISVTIDGGNGSGAFLRPIISKKQREIEFDARPTTQGGGVNITNDTIIFRSEHNLIDGEEIIYNTNGNNPLGITSYFNDLSLPSSITNAFDRTLVNGSRYYAGFINTRSIKLYETRSDYALGINTLGITTENNNGIHKFRTLPKNTLSAIKVENPGSGYQNRQLYVKNSGISSATSTVYFKNHNFNNGDLVVYNHTEDIISGLSSSNYYYILKSDSDRFQLADAGLVSIGATITSNFDRKKYVKFTSDGGNGYHIFKYPDILVSVVVSYASSYVGIVTATPVVTGSIIDAYLYENGSGYGSNVLNLERYPDISVKNGKNGECRATVIDGKIVAVEVLSRGSEYYSEPELRVSGSGTGAILRPVLSDNKLLNVIVVNPGIGYSNTNTNISVISRGSGAKFKSQVRSLTLNNQYRFNTEILIDSPNGLEYGMVGYSPNLGATEFGDDGSKHSPIVGWAYDGNPIYGPYGFADPETQLNHRILRTGYILNTLNITDRPSLTDFPAGYFIEDYEFNNSGDLDLYNGRFCKTPDFPNGVYAYFVGIQTNFATGTLQPKYPYFIGNKFKTKQISENIFLDQSFDFNNKGLSRNTLPYKVNDEYADNDFLIESNEIINQTSVINSITGGKVDSIDILSSGDDYKIEDRIIFNPSNIGSGLDAIVSSIKGKKINSIKTEDQIYTGSILERLDDSNISVKITPYHTLINGDTVIISGLSTSNTRISKNHVIGFSSESCLLQQHLPSNSVAGFVTDIYVSRIPNNVSIGSSLLVENELLSVLNIFRKDGVLRVKRSDVGAAHTETTIISVLSDRFNIQVNTDYFDSKVNDKVYFNPHQSAGIGATAGGSVSNTYRIGNVYKEISVPTQSIYLPNHPFKTNQQVTFGKTASANPLAIARSETDTPFHWPEDGNDTATVYIINQSKDYIGFSTVAGLSTSPVYITNAGSDVYDYYFESQNNQVTCQVQKITATVGLETYHGLQNGDTINLSVNPALSVGIGTTSTEVNLKYNSKYEKLVVNTRKFNSSDVNTSQGSITISNHGFKTGDKVLYTADTAVLNGLSEGEYYVYTVDVNTIKLCETSIDVKLETPNTISISSGGTYHNLGLINPNIQSYKNNNLVFNISDSSLNGYRLKFFYDKDFNNEFVSIAGTSIFNVSYGTSSVTLKYSDSLPSSIFYNLERNGFISTSDTSVTQGSQISFTDSVYNRSYSIFDTVGSASTSFKISLQDTPERYLYENQDCDLLEYSTSSSNVIGGIDNIRILSSGFGYKELPSFSGVESNSGFGAVLIARSKSIGNIGNIQILEQGFEYSSDKTLSPEASVSPISIIRDSYSLDSIDVTFSGRNYASPPQIRLVDANDNIILDDANLSATVASGGIVSINILSPINGLTLNDHRVIAVKNTNGVYISSITQFGTELTCTLSTPILGFSTDVFSVGEEIFVEGIQKDGVSGTGWNSADYNYKFFKVKSYVATVPARVVFDLSELTSNPGIAKTAQTGVMIVSSKNNYPTFKINQSPTLFLLNEPLLTKVGDTFIERNARISETTSGYFKTVGSYVPSKNEIVKGAFSGSVARVTDVIENSGRFEISFSNLLVSGWDNDTGKLNTSNQNTPDNDYYQTLSYSVKSKIDYETLSNPVNSLLHTSGMKNFADMQIENSAGIVSYRNETNDIILLDVIEERRVDTINNFDTAQDIFTINGESRFIKLNNRTLADYFICLSNRVLKIDDISPKFLNKESIGEETDVVVDTITNNYQQYLVQISVPNSQETQFSEIVVLYNDSNIYTFDKATLTTTDALLGNIIGTKDLANNVYLGITPADLFDTDYDYKVIKQKFTSSENTGIGTESIGFINLTSSNNFVGVGTTSDILSKNIGEVDSVYLNVFLQNVVTNKLYYAEVYVDHDSSNTYISEFSFDTNIGISSYIPGSFDASIESGNLIVRYTNNDNNGHLVQSNIVSFGDTSVGVGTYRFKDPLQLDGTERSARFESLYTVSSGVSTNIIETDLTLDSSIKSSIRVSYGNTSALHQVMMINDGEESYTVQYPFLSIGSTSGIGTFGSEISGSKVIMKFYPDADLVGEQLQVQSFNQVIYRDFDFINLPPDLEYGTSLYNISLSQYNAVNGPRRETSSFDLTYDSIPIFKKSFRPDNTTQVDYTTGEINIPSHFFQTGEELTYTPTSTFPGLPASPVGIGSTLNSVGIVTNILPSLVYAIKIDEDNIKLATRREYANAGIGVTFTSIGSGNAHVLEMVKTDVKTIISLNGVVQKPLTYTPIAYSLDSNPSGQVGIAQSFISLSGIATIRSRDLIKIDSEYVLVKNVGLATNVNGPIVGFGTYRLAEVNRGAVGTSVTTHNDGEIGRVYRGAYTINQGKIHFTSPPKGNANERVGEDNLIGVRDSFSGRVYLRQDYTKNIIYDDISDQFTGIGQTFEITVQGISTTGIETGSGVVFINDIYQTPTTSNNAGNNYEYFENSSKTFIEFTGIQDIESGDIVTSDLDVNQNQVPRGGVIVAFGSTNGLGFAPLVGVPQSHISIEVGTGGTIIAAGFTTSFIDGASLSATIGITTDILTGISTGSLYVGQRIKSLDDIIQPDTVINSIGITSVTINNLTLNSVGIGTSLTFEGSIIYGSGYYGSNISIGVTDTTGVGTGGILSASVGLGGTITGFSITNPGFGYTNPLAMVPEPSYENLEVIGVSRVATGATTETGKGLLISLDVGASSTTGIGSTLFEVKSFKVNRPGYNFEIGDVIKPVGLVTAIGLNQPLIDFELTVIDIFDDSFASWQFGELDFIDSIATLQDGVRTRFPLYYNSQLLSIETDPDVIGSGDIDLSSVLLIFINGVIQEPNVSYNFDGGTSFTFSDPPGPDAKVSIYFYRGTRGVDSKLINITETIKNGDIVELYGSKEYPVQQDPRIIYNISSSDVIETNLYSGLGVNETYKRPLYWTKQKVDRFLNGDPVYKTRDSIEAQVYPTAKLIWDLNSTDTTVFVDDSDFFKIEENDYGVTIDEVGLLIVDNQEPRSAKLSASITSGEVTSISIDDGGIGYGVTTLVVKISNPESLDYVGNIGIGSTATATAHLTAGIVTSITITSPGYGYTVPPQALVSPPSFNLESLTGASGSNISGFSGIITGITTTTGTGNHPLALKFFLQRRSPSANFNSLQSGYPIYISNTNVGYGITSVGTEDLSIVGMGTTFVDNIYYIQSINLNGDKADITCNIDSGSNIVGIDTSGTREYPIGEFSWGRITNLLRSETNPISIGVTGLIVDSGLTTFPTAQRREFGLRDNGSVRKKSVNKFDVITLP